MTIGVAPLPRRHEAARRPTAGPVSAGLIATAVIWVGAALVSTQSLATSMTLAFLQVILTALSLAILTRRGDHSHTGPTVVGVLAIHAQMYYGVSNVMPALFAERRPAELELVIRVPSSPTSYYALGTLSAVLFLLGAAGGAAIPWRVLSPRPARAVRDSRRRSSWMPDYGVAIWSCVVLLVVVLIATAEFGLRFDAAMLAEGVTATFTPVQLLLWGGIFYFLPIAPLLAAVALVQARDARAFRSAVALLIVAIVLSLAVLMVWRMRSTAMIAVLLPVALLVYSRMLPLRKTLIPGAAAMVLIYAAVTFVRLSQVAEVLAESTGGSVSFGSVVDAIREGQGGSIMDKAMFDFSYRAAGLEGVAAILHAEDEGRARPLMGRSTVAGFAQSLPAGLRDEVGIPERIKTAPSYLGIFGQSDWVTTFLAELTLDFGPFALIGPAVLAGFLFGLVDCLLFIAGNHSPALQGLLVLRFPWLLTFVLMGSSTAELVVYFFKANFGYTILLVVVSLGVGMSTATRRVRRPAVPVGQV